MVIAQYFEQAAKDGWLLPMKPEYQVDGEDLRVCNPSLGEVGGGRLMSEEETKETTGLHVAEVVVVSPS